MKRITTILLSVFVLLLAIHPVVMFHFCSGNLDSISVMESQTTSGCCLDEQNQDEASIQIGDNCCQDFAFELTTDDYTPQNNISQVDFPVFYHLIFLDTFATSFDRVAESCLPSEYKNGHLFLYETGRDVLSRFCVYII